MLHLQGLGPPPLLHHRPLPASVPVELGGVEPAALSWLSEWQLQPLPLGYLAAPTWGVREASASGAYGVLLREQQAEEAWWA